MDDLIKRLEEAREGSRELDAEILCAIDPHASLDGDGDDVWYGIGLDEDGGPWPRVHDYTTSIDDALTLVPEGWGYEISALPGEKVLVRPVKPCPDGSIETMSRWHSHATSAALALCAAALKARKEETDAL